jgi:hypothetical protein
MKHNYFLWFFLVLLNCLSLRAQDAGLIPKQEATAPVENAKTPPHDSLNTNLPQFYLKVGLNTSSFNSTPDYSAKEKSISSAAFLLGFVGKRLGKRRLFAFESESGLVQKGGAINTTTIQYLPSGSPNAPGHWFPVESLQTIQISYLSTACMLRLCPFDFMYVKAGLNGNCFLSNSYSYNLNYAPFTAGYQYGLGFQFMSRIIGGMIEFEGLNDITSAGSNGPDVTIRNRTILLNAGLVFNLNFPKRQSPPKN